MNALQLGTRIKKLRQERGWSMETLGERVQCTSQAVFHWERGHAMPQLCTFAALAFEFGMTMDALWLGASPAD